MRAVIEYNNKRVDIKTPIRKADAEPETLEGLRQIVLESLISHGLKASVLLTEKEEK